GCGRRRGLDGHRRAHHWRSVGARRGRERVARHRSLARGRRGARRGRLRALRDYPLGRRPGGDLEDSGDLEVGSLEAMPPQVVQTVAMALAYWGSCRPTVTGPICTIRHGDQPGKAVRAVPVQPRYFLRWPRLDSSFRPISIDRDRCWGQCRPSWRWATTSERPSRLSGALPAEEDRSQRPEHDDHGDEDPGG